MSRSRLSPLLSRPVLWLVGAIVLVQVLLFGYGRVTTALGHVRTARAELRMDLAGMVSACRHVRAADAQAGFLLPAAHLAAWSPDPGWRAWSQGPALVTAATAACQAVAPLENALEGVATAAGGGAGASLLAALLAEPEAMAGASEHLYAALAAVERIDARQLQAADEWHAIGDLVHDAQQRREELRSLATLAPHVPRLASALLGGDDQPRTYLLVGQNSDEVRATGGFIGTLGTMRIADGRIADSEIRSSYSWDRLEVPRLPPPEPLQQYMNFSGWYIRDANWWVDYRRSVTQLLLMWDREQGGAEAIDGVIAIDRGALATLLDAVGGVEVPELGGYVSAVNVGPILDDARRGRSALRSYDDYQQSKTEALSALYRGLMSKVTEARGDALARIVAALVGGARDQHILLWFRDPELQAIAEAYGWDGGIHPAEGADYLSVVDSSISYGKVSPYIQRQVDYARRPDGSTDLTITYHNRHSVPRGDTVAWDPLIDGTWWDWRKSVFRRDQAMWVSYTRVLAPSGARLLDSTGWDDPPTESTEGPVTVFGAPVIVPPGQTRVVSLHYANPTPLADPLQVRQQPGVTSPPISTASPLASR